MKSNIIHISKINELEACSSRAIGLLHLLAAAAVKEDSKILQQPTQDEREGIMWLSMDVGMALKSAVEAVENDALKNPPSNLQHAV